MSPSGSELAGPGDVVIVVVGQIVVAVVGTIVVVVVGTVVVVVVGTVVVVVVGQIVVVVVGRVVVVVVGTVVVVVVGTVVVVVVGTIVGAVALPQRPQFVLRLVAALVLVAVPSPAAPPANAPVRTPRGPEASLLTNAAFAWWRVFSMSLTKWTVPEPPDSDNGLVEDAAPNAGSAPRPPDGGGRGGAGAAAPLG